MLKRLSGTFSQSSDHLLLPPPPTSPLAPFGSSPSGSTSAPSSPHHRSGPSPRQTPSASLYPNANAYPFPSVPSGSNRSAAPLAPPELRSATLDRPTLHKTLTSLSALLVALDDLRETTNQRARAEKKVAKGFKDLSACWSDKVAKEMRDKVIAEALVASAGMYEQLAVVDAKLAKSVQNDYESVNEMVGKYFKKTAKEEKAYEEALASLDSKVSKATTSYNKHAARTATHVSHTAHLDSVTASHAAYIATLQSLQAQAAAVQASYAHEIADKRERVGREVARVACGLGEKSWRNRVDGTRRGGEVIGKVVAAGCWVEVGMERGAELVRMEEAPTNSREDGRTSGAHLSRQNDETPRAEATPTSPTTINQSAEKVQHDGGSKTLRGPRAPSTSTTNTFQTFTSRSSLNLSDQARSLAERSAASSPHQPHQESEIASLGSEASGTGRAQATRRDPFPRNESSTLSSPSAPPSHPESVGTILSTKRSSDLGGGRTLPRGWYLDPSFADRFGLEDPHDPTPESASSPSQQDGPSERRFDIVEDRGEAHELELRRPTPRYGTAPSTATLHDLTSSESTDEFGRSQHPERAKVVDTIEKRAEGQTESFVRRMSAKYGENGRQQDVSSVPQPLPMSPPTRSNSRVSMLAKRYSSPPAATASTHEQPTSPSSQARRPLPPTHRHTTSLQFHLPSRPVFGSQPSSSATSLPTTSRIEFSPYSSSLSSSPASQSQPHLASFGADPSSSASSASHYSHSTDPHPSFCACATCTSHHYGRHSDTRQMTKEEEARLQKELRIGTKGGTFRGLVGKGKEVFGRLA